MDTYFFVLKNIETFEIKVLISELNKLKIKYKKEDNNIYIYLNNFNVINYIYNLLLLALICNVKHINANLKFNKNTLNNNTNIALLLIKIFNNIKNYTKTEIEKKDNITRKTGEINLSNKNCVLEQKNKIITEDIETFLNDKMDNLRELINLINNKSKNVFLKRYNNILINNLKLNEITIF